MPTAHVLYPLEPPLDPVKDTLPAGTEAQALAPPVEYWPGGQGVKVVNPEADVYEPAGVERHDVEPEVVEYFPAGQIMTTVGGAVSGKPEGVSDGVEEAAMQTVAPTPEYKGSTQGVQNREAGAAE